MNGSGMLIAFTGIDLPSLGYHSNAKQALRKGTLWELVKNRSRTLQWSVVTSNGRGRHC